MTTVKQLRELMNVWMNPIGLDAEVRVRSQDGSTHPIEKVELIDGRMFLVVPTVIGEKELEIDGWY